VRSFGQQVEVVRLPPLNIKPDSSYVSNQKRLTSSPKTTFTDPVVFRPTLDGLSIDSPSANNIINEYIKSDDRLRSSTARTISNAPNTYRIKTPKGKAKKDDNKTITSEKAALKSFINQQSQQTLDPYYIEACKPGLREADVVTTNKQKKELKVSVSLPAFKPTEPSKSFESAPVEKDVVQDYIKETANKAFNDSAITDDFDGDLMMMEEVASISSNCSTAQENRHIVQELKSSIAASANPSIAASSTNMADWEFGEDEYLLPQPNALDDPEFRITDRGVTYEPNNRPRSKDTYQQYEENHPAFYRKPFGVKGHIKPIAEESFIVRAKKSAEALTAAKEEKDRKERRKLSKKGPEELKRYEATQKKKHGTTVKSLHRDEFAAMLRKSFEETSRQYDCTGINYINNKGL